MSTIPHKDKHFNTQNNKLFRYAGKMEFHKNNLTLTEHGIKTQRNDLYFYEIGFLGTVRFLLN